MKKLLYVFGTRPEAIKMAIPIIKSKNMREDFNVKICITSQQKEMLQDVLRVFNIVPDYDLGIMTENQELTDITSGILNGMRNIITETEADIIIVQGDTTTTFTTALAAFYQKRKIAHIEAGLRTYDLYAPWPEEANRKLTSNIANYHFCPTTESKKNLLSEGIKEENIVVTGNTGIDALFYMQSMFDSSHELEKQILCSLHNKFNNDILGTKFILITGHRRESFGEGIENICYAILELAKSYRHINFIYPVHLNPNVQTPVHKILAEEKNIHLIMPLNYTEFIYLLGKSYIILTDSGGVQEEAASLGIPLLVMREKTERPEGIFAGTAKLTGNKKENIVKEVAALINNKELYSLMARAHNPYGDGLATDRILDYFIKL